MPVVVDDVGVTAHGLAKSLIPKRKAVGVFPDFFTPLGEQTHGIAKKCHRLVEVDEIFSALNGSGVADRSTR